jgi:DNA-binding LacI/PurR family transcriptional regulator
MKRSASPPRYGWDLFQLPNYRPAYQSLTGLRVRYSGNTPRDEGDLIPHIENPYFAIVVCAIDEILKETEYSPLLAN